MINSRTNARITGLLFILGTVPPIVGGLLWGPFVSSPDYLSGSAFASMFGLIGSFSPIQMLLALPILVQELVLAVWLIVKGYKE